MTDSTERPIPHADFNTTERRSEFVYNAARLAALAANAPIVPDPWAEREDAFRTQFLAVIERQCGEQRSRSPEELHGSWMQAYYAMGWIYGEKYDRAAKVHPDLVPYADLGQLERDKDAVFVALCEIARQWVYDMTPPSDREVRMREITFRRRGNGTTHRAHFDLGDDKANALAILEHAGNTNSEIVNDSANPSTEERAL